MVQNQVQQYADAFRRGYLGDVTTQGLLGRVIRGRSAKDFETLSEDPDRKLILLTDPEGLASLVGVPGFSILIKIGWEPGYAIQKIQDGYEMKLVVFREGGPAQLATWDGMIEVTSRAYPDIADRLRRHADAFKNTPFDEFEKDYGCDMSVVDHEGKANPAFMTYERYQKAADTATNARAFLYFVVHLREQYRGDGYTCDDKGVRGMKEYIAPNCKLTELYDCEVINFQAELPVAVRPRKSGITLRGRQMPGYYDPADAGRFYLPRLDWVEEEAKRMNLPPASGDRVKTLLVGIDMQTDFILQEIKDVMGRIIQHAGSLVVSGAVDDLRRFIELIYLYPEKISALLFSMDMHLVWQIFFSRYWKDKANQNPMVFTQILASMVASGEMRARIEPTQEAESYPGDLEKNNQTPLMIWPDHCGVGTQGGSLMPALVEAIYWWSIVRKEQPIFLFKGSVPTTEHYGIFCPCIERPNHPNGGLNTAMLDAIARYDLIGVAGEAEDFCVHDSMVQMLVYYAKKHPQALQKVKFLTDCTSMVFPNNRRIADEFLKKMASQGIQVTTSTKLFI